MTDKQAVEMFGKNSIVYFAGCFLGEYEYIVNSGHITGFFQKQQGSTIEYAVFCEDEFKGVVLCAQELYDNFEDAKNRRDELQKEHGHVLITQKEYDEYKRLKSNQ